MATVNKRYFIENKELATKEYAESAFTAARAYTDTAIANIDMQYETMPVASENTVGKVIQYIGETTPLYTQGYFYLGIAEEVSGVVSYSWKEIGTQEVDLSNYLAKDNTTIYTPTGDYNPATKMYVDSSVQGVETQYTTMPTAEAGNVGKVVQYVGDTNPNYEKGHFYECTSDGEDPATYSWEELNVQQPGGQAEVMPEPSADNVGEIIQYTGEDSGELEQGHFYICVEEEVSGISTYHWEEINVQDTPDMSNYYTKNETVARIPYYAVSVSNFNNLYDVNYRTIFSNIITECYSNNITQPILRIVSNNTVPGVGTMIDITLHTKQSIMTKPNFIHFINNVAMAASSNRHSADNIDTIGTYQIQCNLTWDGDICTCTGINCWSPSYGVLSTDNTAVYTPSSNYNPATKKYVDDTVASAMSAAIKREIVQTLPTSDIKTDTIYMVPKSEPGSQNVYDEYMYINNAWEKIGDTEIDLTDYATKEYVEENTTQQKDTMPEASASNVGEIIQYSGETNEYYTQGYFYICKEEEVSGVSTYYWEAINTGSGEYEFFKGTQTEWDLLTTEQKKNILFAAVEEDGLVLTPEEEEDLISSLGVDGDIEVDMSLEDALDTALDIANGN